MSRKSEVRDLIIDWCSTGEDAEALVNSIADVYGDTEEEVPDAYHPGGYKGRRMVGADRVSPAGSRKPTTEGE